MKNELIVKHNDLIEGFMEMSSNEYKFTLYLISKIRKNDINFRKQKVTIEEYKKFLDYKGNDLYRYINEFEDSLISKHIFVKQKNSESRLRINWFSYIKYEEGEGYLEVAFNKDLEPFLLDIDTNFTKYLLKNIADLKSTYSIRMYELLKQYKNAKFGRPPILLSDLRKMLGTDIVDKKGNVVKSLYGRYSNFKQRVLSKAYKELKENDNTDIYFEFEEIKRGRNVTAIKFQIKEKKHLLNNKNPKEYIEEDLDHSLNYNSKVLELFDLLPVEEQIEHNKKILNGLLNKYEFKFIAADIKYAQKFKPQNFIGFLIDSCNNGHYGKADLEKEEKKIQIQQEKEAAQKKSEESEKKKQKMIEDNARRDFENLSDEDLKEYKEAYEKMARLFKKKMSFKVFVIGILKDRYI